MALFVSMWILIVVVPWDALPHWECPIRSLLGIPCPTCGGTRAIIALKQFNIVSALSLNPLVTLGLLLSGIWAMMLLIPTIPTPDQVKSWIRVSLVSGLVMMMMIHTI
jgi:hypothetical protein